MWLSRSILSPAIALLGWSALYQPAAAQVTTDCNPMNKTCPPDPALGTEYFFNFNRTPLFQAWETKVGPVTYDPEYGAKFTINKQGDSPTIRSRFYIFWGRTEIMLKASPGTGIISSVMFLSDNLDEIDWEFFGGNTTVAQSNYFGKGLQDHHNAGYHVIDGNVQSDYHNYTTVWTKDYLDFYVDGNRVRRLLPEDAKDGYTYPQTPMRLSLGIWAGGDPSLPEGTREWAGGTTDYSQGPFDMYVKSVYIEDFSKGAKEYVFTDKSGSWESIKIVEGNSTVYEALHKEPEKTIAERWADLPQAAKLAVYSGAAALGAIMIGSALLYCIRQRRRGAREAKLAEQRAEQERLELERFKKAGIDPDSFASNASEYNAKEMRREGLMDDDSYSISTPVNPASPLDNGANNLNRGSAVGMTVTTGAGAAVGAAAAAVPPSPHSPTSPRSPHGPMSPTTNGPPNRSFTSPAPGRVASPAPSQRSFTGMDRSASPGVGQPPRSYTTGPGFEGGGGNQGYWGNNGGNQGRFR